MRGAPEQKKKIYVHYFPHSHTDLGWISTLGEYFWGVDIGGGLMNSAR
jgi:hypothetical protein